MSMGLPVEDEPSLLVVDAATTGGDGRCVPVVSVAAKRALAAPAALPFAASVRLIERLRVAARVLFRSFTEGPQGEECHKSTLRKLSTVSLHHPAKLRLPTWRRLPHNLPGVDWGNHE
jgi:hypothetical protein